MSRHLSRNLFLTDTALGAYATVLISVFGAVDSLADKYDQSGMIKVTDYVRALTLIGGAIAAQLFVLSRRLNPNPIPTYTPPGVPGPNKEDL